MFSPKFIFTGRTLTWYLVEKLLRQIRMWNQWQARSSIFFHWRSGKWRTMSSAFWKVIVPAFLRLSTILTEHSCEDGSPQLVRSCNTQLNHRILRVFLMSDSLSIGTPWWELRYSIWNSSFRWPSLHFSEKQWLPVWQKSVSLIFLELMNSVIPSKNRTNPLAPAFTLHCSSQE